MQTLIKQEEKRLTAPFYFDKKLKYLIDTHNVISFDIFDTLLLRPYVKPTDLFWHLEKIFNIEGFKENRIEAEQNARIKHSDKEDITFNQIYDEIDDKYKFLKEKELELEYRVLTSNSEVQNVYNYALQNGKKIIITSDMYLDKNFIEKVLDKNNYKNYEKIYLSSDLMISKGFSNLYKFILNDLKVSPNEILHIGDNYYSDYKTPIKIGIDSYHIEKQIDKLFKNKRTRIFYKNNSDEIGCSIILGTLAMCNIDRQTDYWKHFGFNYAGPVIYAYTKWLDTQFKRDNIEEALFVARDGYTLQKVFEIIKTSNVNSYYIYAQRMLNRICNLSGYVDLLSIQALLDYFKDKNEFLKENTPKIKTIEEGELFLKDNIDIYKSLAQIEKDKYKEYFKHNNININNKIAIIDTISGALSAQKFLETVLNKKVEGYYWFTLKETTDFTQKYRFKTFQDMHDQMFLDWNIMEFFMTSPEPPIQGFVDDKPVYKKASKEEIKRIEVYPFVSEGAIDFAKLMKCFNGIDTFINYNLMLSWVNILSQNPTKFDKKMLSNIKHAGDSNHGTYIYALESWFNKDKPIESIFSLTNQGMYKILTVLGFKVYILRKRFKKYAKI